MLTLSCTHASRHMCIAMSPCTAVPGLCWNLVLFCAGASGPHLEITQNAWKLEADTRTYAQGLPLSYAAFFRDSYVDM